MWFKVRDLTSDPVAMQEKINEVISGNRHSARILNNGFSQGTLSPEVELIYNAYIEECWQKIKAKGHPLLVPQLVVDEAFNLA